MKYLTPKRIAIIVVIVIWGLIGYWGISRGKKTATELADTASVQELGWCAEETPEICIESSGTDAAGNLLLTLRATHSVGLKLTQAEQEFPFDCGMIQFSDNHLLCVGTPPLFGDVVQVDAYDLADGRVVASGSFSDLVSGDSAPVVKEPGTILLTATPFMISVPTLVATPASSAYPSYPSYPAYP